MLVSQESWLSLMVPKVLGSPVGLGGMRPMLFCRLVRHVPLPNLIVPVGRFVRVSFAQQMVNSLF
jgi:hypothetical protein